MTEGYEIGYEESSNIAANRPEGVLESTNTRTYSTRRGWHHSDTGMKLTPEEIEKMLEGFAKEDDFAKKTWSRVLVEGFLQKFMWYFPKRDGENAPSLSQAWAYYEHVTLARHFVGDHVADHTMKRAEPGETEETDLYSPWFTPESSLNEWGIGVGLYFSTLRTMAFIVLLAGLISIPNIIHYNSDEYSGEGGQSDIPFTLKGSTICTNRPLVACTGSDCDGIQATNDATGELVALVQRTDCEGAQLEQGIVNWATMLFLVIAVSLLAWLQRQREVRFDEDKLTVTDYSVLVKNPPKDAYDPEEWRTFFEQFAAKQVTCVTVALDNGELLRKLITRRIVRKRLKSYLPKDFPLDEEDLVRVKIADVVKERESEGSTCFGMLCGCTVLPILRIFGMFQRPENLVDRLYSTTKEIKRLQKKKYNVTKVFVTFETEEGQRAALSALTASHVDIWTNNTRKIAPTALFQNRVLYVCEPPEPSAVRWLELSVSSLRKLYQRAVAVAITCGIVAICALIVKRVRDSSGEYAAGIVITIFNTIIPQVMKLLMLFERHRTDDSWQTSLYLKITLFRWTNTAIIAKFITDFNKTIGGDDSDLLPTINGILIAELTIAPFLRVLDIVSTFKKHILAPRMRTQEQMNLCFVGTPYHLAERYTDFTKVLFLCFFYCALFPGALFFCSLILFVQYYADKFCLMRIWATAPLIGPQLSTFSRRYFFTGALLALALVSSYAWAHFPYDNLCPTGQYGYSGKYFIIETGEELTIEQDASFKFCNQNLFEGAASFWFPAVADKQPDDKQWMTDSQETLTNIYGWTAFGILIAFIVIIFGGSITAGLLSIFKGLYSPDGQDQKIDFSTVEEIFAYVPQIRMGGLSFPFLACDVDDIDQNLIGWNDPHHSYDYHNMIFDVPYKGMKRQTVLTGNTRGTTVISDQASYEEHRPRGKKKKMQAPIFSIVKHWPPDWAKGGETEG